MYIFINILSYFYYLLMMEIIYARFIFSSFTASFFTSEKSKKYTILF